MEETKCMTCGKMIEESQPYFQISEGVVECYDCHRKPKESEDAIPENRR